MSLDTTGRETAQPRTPAASRRPGARRVRVLGTLTGVAAVLLIGLLSVAALSAQAPAGGDAAGSAGGAAAAGGAGGGTVPAGGPAASPDNGIVVTPDDGTAVAAAASWERPVVDASALADRLGVRITEVAVTGGGGLIDLRIQVLDADKADGLHDDDSPPAVVDGATGVVADSLLMGHSHSAAFTAGVSYYYIFENPGNVVQRGGKVSVLLGDTEINDITVQ